MHRLFLACSNQWYVGNTEHKDTRKAVGWACTDAVADGTLPHEAPAGGWQVWDDDTKKMDPQPAITVTRTG